jgi:hypothetical protein
VDLECVLIQSLFCIFTRKNLHCNHKKSKKSVHIKIFFSSSIEETLEEVAAKGVKIFYRETG